MALTINTNASPPTTQESVQRPEPAIPVETDKLANGARDKTTPDAVSLGSSLQEAGLKQRSNLAMGLRGNDSVTKLQLAEKALGKALDIANDLQDKSILAAQDEQTTESRAEIMAEFDKLTKQLDGVAQSTTFNGQQLSSATSPERPTRSERAENAAGNAEIPIHQADQQITAAMDLIDTSNLGTEETKLADIALTNQPAAREAIEVTAAATEQLSSRRDDIQVTIGRFSDQLAKMPISSENAPVENQEIRDARTVEETTAQAKSMILQQSSDAVNAQANALPQTALALLG